MFQLLNREEPKSYHHCGGVLTYNKTSRVNHCIQLIGSTVSVIVHRNRLKPCYGDPNQMTPRTTKPGSQTHSSYTSTTLTQDTPSSSQSLMYCNAFLNRPSIEAGYTSSDLVGIPENTPASSRPVRNRQPPRAFGNSVWH